MFAFMMYFVEHKIQPDVFGSIPETLWWACVTVTTLGYGDVVPITYLGKGVAVIAAFTGVMMIGVPAGIIAAAIVEEWEALKETGRACPQRLEDLGFGE
jgi:voltage-gated potassium channel